MAQTITPYLCVQGAEQAILFYKLVFNAEEKERYQQQGGPIGHCTMVLYGSEIFLSDEFIEIDVLSPKTLKGTTMSVHLVVDDVDQVVARARANGATIEREPSVQPYGERNAKFLDPFGHRWMVASPTQPEP